MTTWMQTWLAPASGAPAPGRRRLDVAPGDDGVDESVTSPSGEVGVVEAQRPQVVGVVLEAQVAVGEGPAIARAVWSPSRTTVTSGARRASAPRAAGPGPVLDGDEVRMGPRGPFGGQLQHLRAERGEHAAVAARRRRGRVERIEIPTMWL